MKHTDKAKFWKVFFILKFKLLEVKLEFSNLSSFVFVEIKLNFSDFGRVFERKS